MRRIVFSFVKARGWYACSSSACSTWIWVWSLFEGFSSGKRASRSAMRRAFRDGFLQR